MQFSSHLLLLPAAIYKASIEQYSTARLALQDRYKRAYTTISVAEDLLLPSILDTFSATITFAESLASNCKTALQQLQQGSIKDNELPVLPELSFIPWNQSLTKSALTASQASLVSQSSLDKKEKEEKQVADKKSKQEKLDTEKRSKENRTAKEEVAATETATSTTRRGTLGKTLQKLAVWRKAPNNDNPTLVGGDAPSKPNEDASKVDQDGFSIPAVIVTDAGRYLYIYIYIYSHAKS